MNLLFFSKTCLANDSEQGLPGWGGKSRGTWALLKVQLALLPPNPEDGKLVLSRQPPWEEKEKPW